MGGLPGYLLITPARDEADHLLDLATTVRAQEWPPALWVVVDDASHDGTTETLERLAERYAWIQPVHLRRGTVDHEPWALLRYSEVVGVGLQAASELAEAEGIPYRYVVNLDADIRCPPHLIAELIARVERDRTIGIAGCNLRVVDEEGTEVGGVEQPEGTPCGNFRLWRRECLDQTGFYPTPQWSGVTALRARNRGWKTVVYEDLVAEAVRDDATRNGVWRGYQQLGEAAWHLGLHPVVLAKQALVASAQRRDLRGLALAVGYLHSAASGRRRSSDQEVRSYYGDILPREQLDALIKRFPRLKKR